jgi:ketosteroid isomerase-like protein
MTTQDLAHEFTALCKKGEFEQAGQRFWSDDVVSREAMPGDMAEIRGRKGVEAKGTWWYANHEIHGVKVEGPYVNGDQFVVRFTMDVTPKDGKRMQMDEVGLYVVRNGKIAEETFFYGFST